MGSPPSPRFLAGESAVDLHSAAETRFSGGEQSCLVNSDESAVAGLVGAETDFMPRSDYFRRCRDRSVDATARQDSINWILKVQTHFHFRPRTAFLAVNFLDRFLSGHSLPQCSGWAFQLLAVACLSLAAKMDEPAVPLLVDLQLFDPIFVFEPKTIQRMELCVMANLQWRLRSVTPFDFLHYFITKLPSSSSLRPDPVENLISGAGDLILRTTRVIDFLGFTPSAIAAAASLCAAGESVDLPADRRHFFPEMLNREMVRSCHQLMNEYLIDTCPSALLKVTVAEPASPPSPVGVLDASGCRSCENPGSTGPVEPPDKRLRSSSPDVHEDHI